MENPLALDQQVCLAVVVAARSIVSFYKPVLEPLGLTHPQYLVMLALWESTPRTVVELSRALALDPGTLSPLLKRLEAADLIVRERSSRDERLLAVKLTERGLALRADAEKVPRAVAAKLGMDAQQLALLRDTLNHLINAADGSDTARSGTVAGEPIDNVAGVTPDRKSGQRSPGEEAASR